MMRFTGHTEKWGSFVDVKMNAPELLSKQLKRAQRGTVMLSSVTDPYQPAEAKYKLTRKCLEALALYQFPVSILTKSPLVLRDMDIITDINDIEVGLTITTDNDKVRKIFEPDAPPISARIDALKKLHNEGISTYVFIGPLLPMDSAVLANSIKPYTGRILIDRMNYTNKTKWLYRKYKIEKWLDIKYIERVTSRLEHKLASKDISVIC
jgi:DNA repair photolyase